MKTLTQIRTDLSKPKLSDTAWTQKVIMTALFDIITYLEQQERHNHQEQSHDPDQHNDPDPTGQRASS